MVFPITSWVAVNALGLLECRLCQEAVARLYFKKRAPTLTDLSINATCQLEKTENFRVREQF